MPSLYVEIEIDAPRSAVWQALLNKQDWLRWNTFLYDRDPVQPFEQGKMVWLSLKRVSREEETEFQPTITLLQPEVCLQWLSSAPGFRNEHVFELLDIGKRTKYIHRENFSGPLTRLFFPFIRQDEQQGLRRMAQELKQYVERS
ncbi:SRPBCC domain-containing protein [Oculatella sp. FACHB-28]|uniref:SRPBCC domain-containing protein n=1 Tax=Cyanophyceae TaxID=3028117 RepID=UPI0016860567|nr:MULTISPECIES: SRPBCC domain-containing protein [Cyanophyceae]MBD1998474.1 SRPBCC domain-containing protein [Leptolyngbya sp. FACHB-541]MBD2059620.1 SRPBCC domain-containing protein [Oculatella sp. FACHB-28]